MCVCVCAYIFKRWMNEWSEQTQHKFQFQFYMHLSKRHAIGIQCGCFCGSIGAIFLQYYPFNKHKNRRRVITAIDFR